MQLMTYINISAAKVDGHIIFEFLKKYQYIFGFVCDVDCVFQFKEERPPSARQSLNFFETTHKRLKKKRKLPTDAKDQKERLYSSNCHH
jgi:hypothetical protein